MVISNKNRHQPTNQSSNHQPVSSFSTTNGTSTTTSALRTLVSSRSRSSSHPSSDVPSTTASTRSVASSPTTAVVLESVISFLEELKLNDVANTIKSRKGSVSSQNTPATRRLINSLLTKSKVTGLVDSADEPVRVEDPTSEWSNDAAEKSAVSVLKQILQLDQYIPRHKIKEISQRLGTVTPVGFAPSLGLDGKQVGYPRYRAPPARPSGRVEPPLTPSPKNSPAVPKSSPLKQQRSPEVVLPQISLGSRIGSPLENVPRSEEYQPKSRESDSFDPTDQYRDDDDPGYRIRDLWEADLIEEIQGRERNDPEAVRFPYYAAFVLAPVSNRKQRYPQYASRDHPHSADALQRQQSATGMQTKDSIDAMGSPQFKITDQSSPFPSSMRPGTPVRRSSTSSHCSSHVLNSTPLRGSVAGNQHSSSHGSPFSSRTGFDLICGGSSPSLASDASPMVDGSRRCSSPTFGVPSPSGPVDNDDELLSVTGSVPPPALSGFHCGNRLNSPTPVVADSPVVPVVVAPTGSVKACSKQSSTSKLSRGICQSQVPSPKSPVFGSSDAEVFREGTFSRADVNSTKDTRSFKSAKSKVLKPKKLSLSPVTATSLDGLCSSAVSPVEVSPEAGVGDFASPTSFDIECSDPFNEDDLAVDIAIADGNRWREIYCDGNRELHRQKKIQGKPATFPNILYPENSDPNYPIIEDTKVIDCLNLKVIFERNKTGFENYKDFQVKLGSVVAGRYVIESQLGQAAFSKALKCYDKKLKQNVCMKVIRNDKDYVDQSLDEIKLLRYINCNGDVDLVYCLRLFEFFYYKEHLIIVTELLKENLYEFSRKHREKGMPYFTIGRIQRVAVQALTALHYIHSLRLIHSDLKPENILMKNSDNCEIKVIDFGSSCFEDDVLSLYVQSRSYRAPEVLLGLPYDQKIDLWSLGCILAELWTGYVLFQNDSVAALLARVVGILGQLPYYMVCKGQSVSDHFTQDGQLFTVQLDEQACPRGGKRIRILLPKPSSLKQRMRTNDSVFVDFLSRLLQTDPAKRFTAAEALQHPFLQPGRYSDGL